MKKVTITLWADETFIKTLLANTTLSGLKSKVDNGKPLQPMDQLALTCQMEMRGAGEDQILESISPEWDGHFGVVLDGRSVVEL